jgi:hypothetical protein
MSLALAVHSNFPRGGIYIYHLENTNNRVVQSQPAFLGRQDQEDGKVGKEIDNN